MTSVRSLALGLGLLLAAAATGLAGPPLVDRLPAGAQVVGYVDMAAWRASPALASIDTDRLLSAAGFTDGRLDGLQGGSFDRVAMGGWPKGEDMGLVLLVEGQWDSAAMKSSLLEQGAVEIAVAGHPAYKLPKDEDGDELVVSELAEGLLAVSDFDLAERARGGGGPLPPSLATEVAALPANLSGWVLVADPSRTTSAGGLDAGTAGMAQGLRSLGLWVRTADKVQLGATALAADAQTAAQLGAAVQFGLLALSSQGGGQYADLLRGLKFDSAGERLNLGLELTGEQLAGFLSGLSAGAASAASAPAR